MRVCLLAMVVAATALAGCAGRAIKQGMDGLLGQPLGAAVAKLGVPADERVIAGQKVYIWHTRDLTEGTETKCQIRVIMFGDTIGSWDFEGHEAQCSRYAARLRS